MAQTATRPADGPKKIGPQAGPQTQALSTKADIGIYGGAAGAGKTYVILLECLRHINKKGFEAIIFRRTRGQVTQQGGLWSKSEELYPFLSGDPNNTSLLWRFPAGSGIGFASMQYEKDKFQFMGAELALICFDELTHFTESQFFYMVSRNRSMCGVRPYIRATCNPDVDSWVAKFIAWWIDQETGLPIPERSGVLRYFGRDQDTIIWGDSPQEVYDLAPYLFDAAMAAGSTLTDLVKSVTFIPGKLSDNAELMRKDPSYLGGLMSLTWVEQQRLLGGNWKIRASAGDFFKKHQFKVVDRTPSDIIAVCRYWDRAATEPSAANPDPDWTVGTLMARTRDGRFCILDVVRMRGTPGMVEKTIRETTAQDAARFRMNSYWVTLEQDPGQAGKVEAALYTNVLSQYDVRFRPARHDKKVRAKPYSSAVEHGNVSIVNGPWVDVFLGIHEAFPTPGVHDDDVDSAGGAYSEVAEETDNWDAWSS